MIWYSIPYRPKSNRNRHFRLSRKLMSLFISMIWKGRKINSKIYSLQDPARLSRTLMHSSCNILHDLRFFANFLQDRNYCCNLARFLQESFEIFLPTNFLPYSCEPLASAERPARNSWFLQDVEFILARNKFSVVYGIDNSFSLVTQADSSEDSHQFRSSTFDTNHDSNRNHSCFFLSHFEGILNFFADFSHLKGFPSSFGLLRAAIWKLQRLAMFKVPV